MELDFFNYKLKKRNGLGPIQKLHGVCQVRKQELLFRCDFPIVEFFRVRCQTKQDNFFIFKARVFKLGTLILRYILHKL